MQGGGVVTCTLPAGVTFVDVGGGASWACVQEGGVVTCTWSGGPLPVGAAPPITVSLKAPAVAGAITNTAWVSATTADLEPVNNAGEAQTTVVPNQPPLVPLNSFPLDGSEDQSTELMLCWSGSDPDGDDLTYDVYFGISPTLTLVSSDQYATTYTPGLLADQTTYTWKIVARDDLGAETEGPVWSFTTGSGSFCHPLTTGVTPALGGVVTASPGPNCGSDYLPGMVVTLTATANPGYVFTGWGGDASGTVVTTTVIMAGNRSVVANFELEQVGKWLYLPLVLRNH